MPEPSGKEYFRIKKAAREGRLAFLSLLYDIFFTHKVFEAFFECHPRSIEHRSDYFHALVNRNVVSEISVIRHRENGQYASDNEKRVLVTYIVHRRIAAESALQIEQLRHVYEAERYKGRHHAVQPLFARDEYINKKQGYTEEYRGLISVQTEYAYARDKHRGKQYQFAAVLVLEI